MKIVVLDGHAANPGDLDWSPLAALGELTVHDRTPVALTVERAVGAQVVLTNKVPLGAAELAVLPELRCIGVLATGYNVVDVAAARACNVAVTNVPAYSTPSVAQHVFALLLELTRGTGRHADLVRRGRWCTSPDFAFWETPQVELHGLTFGIVGFGAIGRAVAGIARAFGMRVLVHTRTPDRSTFPDIAFVGLDELFREADVVSLHCPLTEETRALVNPARLGEMKPGAYLINTGRGPLVDEPALAAALQSGRIAGAGLDVLSQEPPPADNPLLSAPNCVITPHLAWATRAARQRLLDVAMANVKAFVEGKPQNRVD
ncbi:MAG: D-2-hydroxyacid dehydrogenase [Deltaproteobacteria bacterium]|nr:MAG: D-2-hydroxyacid dehydrogenase [Deltaproteobacteria bacterium]